MTLRVRRCSSAGARCQARRDRRRDSGVQPTPGALLAPVVAVAAVAPVTLAGMFSWGTLYPIGDFPDTVRTVWLGLALSGAAVCAVALRPGLRP